MKTVSILGKGGVGKTTVAINLACALGLLNRRVSLVDMNFTTSHLAVQTGGVPNNTINDSLIHGERISDALHPYYNIFIVPAAMSFCDPSYFPTEGIGERVKESLSDFEVVILDSAPGFGDECMSSIRASDEAIIVVNPTMASVADGIKSKQLAEEVNCRVLGVVVNKHKDKGFQLKPEQIAGLMELPLLSTIKDDDDFLKSETMRMPMVFHNKGKSKEFFRLANVVIGQDFGLRPPVQANRAQIAATG